MLRRVGASCLLNGASCLLNVGASCLLKVGRVVLGRVFFGASCLGASCLNLNLNSLLVKRHIDNPSPGAVTGGN